MFASEGHFEAVSWKPSRGATPLTTSFTGSHDLIVSLEKWKNQVGHGECPSPKRRRVTDDVIDLVQDESVNGEPAQELTNESPPHELVNGTGSS